MTDDHPSNALFTARLTVLAWVMRTKPGNYQTNEELADAFCSTLPADLGLELQTTRNPSALVYESRWFQRGRATEEFPKPFCAEQAGDARVLACAAMIGLEE
jgi:hypothetical protein